MRSRRQRGQSAKAGLDRARHRRVLVGRVARARAVADLAVSLIAEFVPALKSVPVRTTPSSSLVHVLFGELNMWRRSMGAPPSALAARAERTVYSSFSWVVMILRPDLAEQR